MVDLVICVLSQKVQLILKINIMTFSRQLIEALISISRRITESVPIVILVTFDKMFTSESHGQM